jgi:hypothetical protein
MAYRPNGARRDKGRVPTEWRFLLNILGIAKVEVFAKYVPEEIVVTGNSVHATGRLADRVISGRLDPHLALGGDSYTVREPDPGPPVTSSSQLWRGRPSQVRPGRSVTSRDRPVEVGYDRPAPSSHDTLSPSGTGRAKARQRNTRGTRSSVYRGTFVDGVYVSRPIR